MPPLLVIFSGFSLPISHSPTHPLMSEAKMLPASPLALRTLTDVIDPKIA